VHVFRRPNRPGGRTFTRWRGASTFPGRETNARALYRGASLHGLVSPALPGFVAAWPLFTFEVSARVAPFQRVAGTGCAEIFRHLCRTENFRLLIWLSLEPRFSR